MITLAIASAFFYFTNQNYAIFNGHTGINSVPTPKFLGVDWRDADPVLLLDARRRGALLLGRRLSRRARRSGSRCRGSATTRAAWRRSASTSTPIASRPMSFAALIAGARRRPARVEQRRDRAGHGQRRRRRSTSSSSRSSAGSRNPIGPFIGALIYAVLQDLRPRRSGERRPRRQPLPAADRARLPRHRVLFARRRASAFGRAGAIAARARSAGRGGGGHG